MQGEMQVSGHGSEELPSWSSGKANANDKGI